MTPVRVDVQVGFRSRTSVRHSLALLSSVLLVATLFSCRSIEYWLLSDSCFEGVHPPSDEALIEHFERNREAFELLRSMLKQDSSVLGLDRSRQIVTHGDEHLSHRVEEYIDLAEELGLCMGFRSAAGGNGMEALVYVTWMMMHGFSKGYMYSEDDPGACLVENLDVHEKEKGYFLRSLGGNWYLVFERD